jgi:hypothetical protein
MGSFFEKERTAQHHQDGFFLWKRENFTTLSRQVLSLEKRELHKHCQDKFFLWKRENCPALS